MDNEMNIYETYILARYFYRIGQPLISDSLYDEIHEHMLENKELTEYVSRTYDDDPIPVYLLNKFGYISLNTNQNKKRDTSFLSEDKSMSIKKVDTIDEVYAFFKKFYGEEMIVSIKMDGDNIKSEVNESEWILSLTRGRNSNGFDVTDAMLRVIPNDFKIYGHRVVVGEVFVLPRYLEYLRSKYDPTKYKTSKTAATTMLRCPQEHYEEDYKFLKYVVFSCDGLCDTVSQTYEKLKECGFEIPPYQIINNYPASYLEFKTWFEDVMKIMRQKQIDRELPADGLVIELNNYETVTKIKNQYDERQIAVKFGYWAPQTYEGIITSIIMDQRRVFCCCKVTIEHVLTSDGCTASVINTFNPSFLVDFGLNVGSKIVFERQSGTVNILVNGKKIKLEQISLFE